MVYLFLLILVVESLINFLFGNLRRLIDCLVEWNWSSEEGVDDVRVVVELLVDHQGKDTHLSSTTVV